MDVAAFELTAAWRAAFVPVGVVIAAVLAFGGLYLTRRHERTLKFDEVHWLKRSEAYERFSGRLQSYIVAEARVRGTGKAAEVLDAEFLELALSAAALQLYAPRNVIASIRSIFETVMISFPVVNGTQSKVSRRVTTAASDRLDESLVTLLNSFLLVSRRDLVSGQADEEYEELPD